MQTHKDPITEDSLELSLETLQSQEIKELWEVISKYKKELRPWLDWVDMIQSYEEYQDYMSRVQYEESIGIQKGYVVCINGVAQGEIAFDDFDARTRSCNLGYWLSPEYQQRGIMFRACVEAINQIFDTLNIDKINIRFIGSNKASLGIGTKLGFKIDGVLRKNLLYQGKLEDEVVMSCFREEWKF